MNSILISTSKNVYKTRYYTRTVALVNFIRSDISAFEKIVVYEDHVMLQRFQYFLSLISPSVQVHRAHELCECSIRHGLGHIPIVNPFVETLSQACAYRKIRNSNDVCISTTTYGGMRALFLKKLGKVDFHIHEDHDFDPARYTSTIPKAYSAILEKIVIANADLVISVSDTLAKIRTMQGARKVYMIPNGVNTNLFKQAIQLRKNRRQECYGTVVYCGALLYEWGVDLLIKAIAQINKQRQVRLLLAGSGKLIPQLKKLVNDLHLEKVVNFLGVVDHKLLPRIFSQAVIGVAPYRKGFTAEYGDPLKIKEYLSSGLPVVSTKVGETPQFLHKCKGGIVVNPDEGELADAILSLLDNRELLETMSVCGSKYVNNRFDWKTLFKKEMKIISKESGHPI